MSWYVAAVITGIALLSLDGHPLAALWVAVALSATVAFLHAIYLVQRRGARRMPIEFKDRRAAHFKEREPDSLKSMIPRHRRRLDRWALGQWVAIAIGGSGIAVGLHLTKSQPLDHVGLVYTVCSIGWIVLWVSVYVSAAFDWFLITPKISGIVCPGPCERSGRQRWVGITALWSFHRGLARLLVPASLLGSAAAIGALTESSAGRAIAFSVAGVLSVALAEFQLQGKVALNFGLNARRYVGDRVWLVRETNESVSRQAGYIVDVSAEGAKFKYVDDEGEYLHRDKSGAIVAGRPFDEKHDDDGKPVQLLDLNERPRVRDAHSPCRVACTGVNWYCWRNPLAFNQTAGGDDTPEEQSSADSLESGAAGTAET